MITTRSIDLLLKGVKSRSMTRRSLIKYKVPKRVSVTKVKPLKLKALRVGKIKGVKIKKPSRISIPKFKV